MRAQHVLTRSGTTAVGAVGRTVLSTFSAARSPPAVVRFACLPTSCMQRACAQSDRTQSRAARRRRSRQLRRTAYYPQSGRVGGDPRAWHCDAEGAQYSQIGAAANRAWQRRDRSVAHIPARKSQPTACGTVHAATGESWRASQRRRRAAQFFQLSEQPDRIRQCRDLSIGNAPAHQDAARTQLDRGQRAMLADAVRG